MAGTFNLKNQLAAYDLLEERGVGSRRVAVASMLDMLQKREERLRAALQAIITAAAESQGGPGPDDEQGSLGLSEHAPEIESARTLLKELDES